MLSEDPTSVWEPFAVTTALSPFTSPSMDASSFVKADPSYSLLAEPVVIVTGAGVIFNVPDTNVAL